MKANVPTDSPPPLFSMSPLGNLVLSPAPSIPLRRSELLSAVPGTKRSGAATFLAKAEITDPHVTARVSRSKSWKYRSLAEFYLSVGRPFVGGRLSEPETEVVARMAEHDLTAMLPGQCFQNAFLVAYTIHDLHYCEGLAIRRSELVQHAWLSLNNKPIDPTWYEDGDWPPTQSLSKLIRRIESNIATRDYYGIAIPLVYLQNLIGGDGIVRPLAEGIAQNFAPLRRGLAPCFPGWNQ